MNIVFVENTAKIAIKDQQFLFLDGDTVIELNHQDVAAIVIENTQTSLSVQTLIHCDKNDILCIVCDERHWPVLTLLNQHKYHRLTQKLNEQINWSTERKERLANQIIYHKVKGQQQLLRQQALDEDDAFDDILHKIEQNVHVKHQEAIAARIYFKRLFGRTFVRFNDDYMNHALNYAYMCIGALIAQIVVAKGLHPSLGLIHYSTFNNFNLVFDIIEVYRPLVDKTVLDGIPKYDSLCKEFKHDLLKVLKAQVFLNGSEVPIRHSVEQYIDSMNSYFAKGTDVIFPSMFES